MMTDTRTFTETWLEDLDSGVIGVQLVDVNHPLEIYVGASDMGLARLQIRCTERPTLPHLSELVLVDLDDSGGSWVLSLTLQDRRFNEVFVRLTTHLVDRSRPAPTATAALDAVAQVFDQWRRLLRPRPLRRLSLEELRGLVCELWYLLEVAIIGRTAHEAVDGWNGPLGAPQDFWYADAGFTEVKGVGVSGKDVRISSAEQLDAEGMSLIVLVTEQVPQSIGGAMNLIELLDRVTSLLDAEKSELDGLELRIRQLGVNPQDPYYAETWFTIQSVSNFVVAAEFPAIRASELPPEVAYVQYALKLAALEPFKSSHSTFA